MITFHLNHIAHGGGKMDGASSHGSRVIVGIIGATTGQTLMAGNIGPTTQSGGVTVVGHERSHLMIGTTG